MGTYKFYWLNYKCDRCGKAAQTAPSSSSKNLDQTIPRCHLCHRRLCGACYNLELCTEHHAQMQAQTKEKLVATSARGEKQHKLAVVLAIIVAIWLLIEFFRVLDGSSSSLFGIPAWIFDVGALVMALVYLGWQPGTTLKTIHAIIDLDPGATSPVPVQSVVKPAAGAGQHVPMQAASIALAAEMKKPAEIACPNCGKTVAATSKFCLKCGYTLAVGR